MKSRKQTPIKDKNKLGLIDKDIESSPFQYDADASAQRKHKLKQERIEQQKLDEQKKKKKKVKKILSKKKQEPVK